VAPDPHALARAAGEAMYRKDNASRSLGMALEQIGPGYARMSMTVREDMVNGHHICHGGLIFTLADSTFAFACNSYNHAAVAQGATIEFLAPGKLGDVLTAVGEERHAAGRTGVYDIRVSNQEGRAIALFRGKSFRIGGHVVEPPVQKEQP
jgi:acyl-CoA thioesterase